MVFDTDHYYMMYSLCCIYILIWHCTHKATYKQRKHDSCLMSHFPLVCFHLCHIKSNQFYPSTKGFFFFLIFLHVDLSDKLFRDIQRWNLNPSGESYKQYTYDILSKRLKWLMFPYKLKVWFTICKMKQLFKLFFLFHLLIVGVNRQQAEMVSK